METPVQDLAFHVLSPGQQSGTQCHTLVKLGTSCLGAVLGLVSQVDIGLAPYHHALVSIYIVSCALNFASLPMFVLFAVYHNNNFLEMLHNITCVYILHIDTSWCLMVFSMYARL